MAVIRVPRPPKHSYDPDRPMGCLVKAQVDHMHHAARRLPSSYRSDIDIYVNAIQTEREAAEYVRQVTEAIHRAHEDSARKRVKLTPKKRKRVIEIAAVADERPRRKQVKKKASRKKKR